MDIYKNKVSQHTRSQAKKNSAYLLSDLLEWYGAKNSTDSSSGRNLFIAAYEKETNKKLPKNRTPKALIEQGFPKNINEYSTKLKWDNYYIANALIFLKQLDLIYTQHTKTIEQKYAQIPDIYYRNSLNLSKSLLLDSICLLGDWAEYTEDVPGAFGMYKNRFEDIMHLYHSAKQVIYSHVSPFSFQDNHAETSINQLRMAIELRIRYGFGISAKIEKSTSNIVPFNLSNIFLSIKKHKKDIQFSTPLENIERIYGWSNIYMHTGLKQYAWSPIEALDYLSPFLIGGEHPAGYSVHAGIKINKSTLRNVQKTAETFIDKSKFKLVFWPLSKCEVVIIEN